MDNNDVINLEISIRNEFIYGDDKKIQDIYETPDDFLTFLYAAYILKRLNPEFYLLNKEYPNILSRMIGKYRSKIEDSSDKQCINEMISFLNNINNIKDKEKQEKIKKYMTREENKRRVDFADQDEFISSLGYDGIVLNSIYEKNTDNASNDSLFLISINYLIETIPTIFLERDNYEFIINYLQEYKNKLKFYELSTKRYLKDTEYLLNDIYSINDIKVMIKKHG